MNTQCGICGRNIQQGIYVGGPITGGFCEGHPTNVWHPPYPSVGTPYTDVGTQIKDRCPLTNSSHEKALVRVVKEGHYTEKGLSENGFIQSLCLCGKVLSENEVTRLRVDRTWKWDDSNWTDFPKPNQ